MPDRDTVRKQSGNSDIADPTAAEAWYFVMIGGQQNMSRVGYHGFHYAGFVDIKLQ